MDTPQIDELLIFLGQMAGAVIAIAAALAILNKLIFSKINKKIEAIETELKPNHGSSLRDAINRIEENQGEMRIDLKDVREKVDNHIEWHLDHK
jgi:hypothetical protein